MKKKGILALLLILVSSICIFTLTACEKEQPEEVHVHEYTMLNYDQENHWYECYCGQKQSLEAHFGGSAVCEGKSVCQLCETTYGEFENCVFANNICVTCGRNQPSEGMSYRLIEQGNEYEYELVDIGNCKDENVVIPKFYKNIPVTKIADKAFFNTSFLKSVYIPHGIKTIGEYAFLSCSSLKTISIANSVQTIGKGALSNCTSLEFNKKDDLAYLGNENNPYFYLFGNNNKESSTVNIDKDCKIIGDNVFDGNKNLSSIIIPNGVVSIGSFAFHNCNSLGEIIIPNSMINVGASAFSNCSNIESIVLSKRLTHIGENAFSYCTPLSNFVIPESVVYIGAYAFKGSEIDNVKIPNGVKRIEKGAFSWTNITKITIPASVESVGDFAFEYCQLLTKVKIENGLKEIGKYAFKKCNLLQSINIPRSVTKIDEGAFQSCEQLISVNFDKDIKLNNFSSYLFQECTSLKSIIIPKSVKVLDEFIFDSCESLTNISVPDGIMNVNEYAFDNCFNLEYTEKDGLRYLGNEDNKYVYLVGKTDTSLTTARIADTCSYIGAYAFSGCKALSSVVIGASVIKIDNNAFYGCTSFNEIYYKGTEPLWNMIIINNTGNSNVKMATRYYYVPNKSQLPNDGGNYWRYVNDVPTIWEVE